MKSFSGTRARPILAAACGIFIASGVGAFRAQADEWNKKTILTVNEPIQVTDTVLNPGQYVLKLADSNSDRHIVQIFNSDQTHLINTVMAVPNYRLQPTGRSQFMFWETPPGTARALRAWFYPGDNYGQEFRYPSHPLVLEARATQPSSVTSVATAPPAQEVTPPAPQPAPQAETEPAPAPEQPSTQAEQPATQPQEQPEIAQDNPPPAPAPAPATQSAQQEQPKPKELPQTSSPYGVFGLAGIGLLSLAGLLRLKRLA